MKARENSKQVTTAPSVRLRLPVATAVTDAGFDPYEKKLLGITAMTSLLGKQRFNELLGDLIEKPQGKTTLVPESDKRQALNTANDDFKDE